MNIGCVVYKKDFMTGKMSADWRLLIGKEFVSGSGDAIGIPGKTYVGNYKIMYFNDKKESAGTYDLVVTDKGNCLDLAWYRDGIKLYCGIGMMQGKLLIAGWMKLEIA